MKKQDGYYVEERRINIFDMMRWVIGRWKIFIVFAVFGAVCVCAWQYYKDYKNHMNAYQSALQEQVKEDVSLETYLNPLSEAQIKGTYSALFYYRLIQEGTDYMDQSLLMQINPYKEDRITLDYSVRGEKDEVVKNIDLFFSSEEFLSELNERLMWGEEDYFLRELVSVEASETGISIVTVASSEELVEQLATEVKDILKKTYGNELDNVSERKQVQVDQELAEKKNTILENIASNQVNYRTQCQTLTNDQINLFQYLVEQETGEGIEVADNNSEPVLEPTRINKKMAFVGIFVGIVVGIISLMIIYTFSGAIHGEEEIRNLFGIHVLGCVDLRKKVKVHEQIERVCAEVVSMCKQNGINKVVFTSSMLSKLSADMSEELNMMCKQLGIDSYCVENIVYNTDGYNKASESKNIVLIEITDKSKCAEIAKELNTCLRNNIVCNGVIMVEA